ncbi:hypothetical protein [Kitasatospora sp. NPDC097691]|uniref:hypothetical protein n=1 Tax=Kitasatospora sp. NPDC097691 TaxID=3157231 RepID=UPI00332328BE
MDDTDPRHAGSKHLPRSSPGLPGPEDAAEAYGYLMEQRFATGTVVTVDGGTLLV